MSKQHFTDEFKIEAVKQITELGYSTSEVASRLGVSAHSLYAWKKRFNKPVIQRTQEDAQEAELKRLRQELKRVTREWTFGTSQLVTETIQCESTQPKLGNRYYVYSNP